MIKITEDQMRAWEAADRTLQRLGYTFHGGREWTPPADKEPDFDLNAKLQRQLDTLINWCAWDCPQCPPGARQICNSTPSFPDRHPTCTHVVKAWLDKIEAGKPNTCGTCLQSDCTITTKIGFTWCGIETVTIPTDYVCAQWKPKHIIE